MLNFIQKKNFTAQNISKLNVQWQCKNTLNMLLIITNFNLSTF